jgi:hypothetical protein
MSKRQLIIGFSGKKQSGKNCCARRVICDYINIKIGQERLVLDYDSDNTDILDTFKDNRRLILDTPSEDSEEFASAYSVKMYSFADPLKKFCTDVLGLDHEQCYGADKTKNSQTHIRWESMPEEIRAKYSRPRRGVGGILPAKGNMTAREVMQVFGSDICRKLDTNCWARGTYSSISNDNYDLAIITDMRFPNEVSIGTERGAKACRLMRNKLEDTHESELALDNFPLAEYSCVIYNQKAKIQDTHEALRNYTYKWFRDYSVV